jgi:hypothetical protein
MGKALSVYYAIKPILPRRAQISLRRSFIRWKKDSVADIWPIDHGASAPPHGWPGWPDGKQFALVLTHDVDTGKGHERCQNLVRLEMELGFRSSFQFVPERYQVSKPLREELVQNGFEVGVHGLLHDGKLFSSKQVFDGRAGRINHYLREWGAYGFRAPAMHHNLDWIGDLEIAYDMSTFDTDPFEPQSDGVGTIFPFLVRTPRRSYVELPYTLAQDFTLFVLLNFKDIEVWRRKLDWVVTHGGMVLVNTHPDYMSFNGRAGYEEYPVERYRELLQYVAANYRDRYWHALPKTVAAYAEGIFT